MVTAHKAKMEQDLDHHNNSFGHFLQKGSVDIQELSAGEFQVPPNLDDTHLAKWEEMRVQLNVMVANAKGSKVKSANTCGNSSGKPSLPNKGTNNSCNGQANCSQNNCNQSQNWQQGGIKDPVSAKSVKVGAISDMGV